MIKTTYYFNNQISSKYYYDIYGDIIKIERWGFGPQNKSYKYEIKYLNKGVLHRVNGPAVIYFSKKGSVYKEVYYLNNKIHNSIGPAIILKENNKVYKFYYINNHLISENVFFSILENKMINEN